MKTSKPVASSASHRSMVQVLSVYPDCDKDSIIYLSEPTGPSCHTGAKNCWWTTAGISNGELKVQGSHTSEQHVPRTSLQELEYTILCREQEAARNPGECCASPA